MGQVGIVLLCHLSIRSIPDVCPKASSVVKLTLLYII